MRVTVNDRAHDLADGARLGDLLGTLGLEVRHVVVERNGEVVERSHAAETRLADGDRLLIVRAVAGGADPAGGRPADVAAGRGARGLPCVSEVGARRQARLEDARLYVICDARAQAGDLEALLRATAGASADLLQLRDKHATDAQLRAAAAVFRRVCDDTGALFVLNDRPDLAVEVGADGVHVGQDDAHPDEVRAVVGPDLLVGRSTHAPEQLRAAADEDVDYVAVGPVHATPTKAGRPAVGLEYVRHAAEAASRPWFAIGGVEPESIEAILRAGARRVAVVRAVTHAADPGAATWALRRSLARYH